MVVIANALSEGPAMAKEAGSPWNQSPSRLLFFLRHRICFGCRTWVGNYDISASLLLR